MAGIKLDKYLAKFIEHGVEDQETILELKEEHLEQMGVPLGHKLKIIKKIKDVRAERGLSTAPQSRQGTERETKAQPAASAPEDEKHKSSLKDGDFDEHESHNRFLEALNAWRDAKGEEDTSKEQVQSSSKKVKFNDNQVENSIVTLSKSKQNKQPDLKK